MKVRILIAAALVCLFSLAYPQDKGLGGPDSYGYRWIDSDEVGGPVYGWVDISGYGTPLNLGDEDTSSDVYLGFYVNYYGSYYNMLKVMSNGYVSFTSSFCEFQNSSIPSTSDPNGIVAPFWCDLDPSAQGNIYYYNDYTYSRLIIQYENIVQYGESSGNTFQIFIYSNGQTYFQYKTMGGSMLNACTAGIESPTGTVGLQVAYNTTYIKNNLAVRIYPSVVVTDGTLAVSETTLNYGNVTLNEKSTKPFTIYNNHATEVLEGEITTITGYSVTESAKNVLAFEINPLDSMVYDLAFQPVSAQSYNGYIIITSTDTQNASDSIYVSGTGAAPNIYVSQADTLTADVFVGGNAEKYFNIVNNGTGNLEYNLRVSQISKGSGGPDSYGYTWADSDGAGGPEYLWKEISDKGTAVTLGDEGFFTATLGFTFNFYGTNFTSVKIGANGFLTFTSSSGSPTNQAIPSATDPNNVIAAFWDDLDPSIQGNIYYYYDSVFKRFIVQYDNIVRFGTTAGNTFEIILNSDGTIIYQYKALNGLMNSCTVGIENSDGTTGLQPAYNSAYLKNSFAIEFYPPTWISITPRWDYILPSDTTEVTVGFKSANLTPGIHYTNLNIDSTDPDTPTVTVPVKFNVIELTAPQNVTTSLVGATIRLSWTAVPYATSYKIYSSSTPYGTFVEDTTGTINGTQWTTNIVNVRKFYKVTAYGTK